MLAKSRCKLPTMYDVRRSIEQKSNEPLNEPAPKSNHQENQIRSSSNTVSYTLQRLYVYSMS